MPTNGTGGAVGVSPGVPSLELLQPAVNTAAETTINAGTTGFNNLYIFIELLLLNSDPPGWVADSYLLLTVPVYV
jgi:hypothetical protein